MYMIENLKEADNANRKQKSNQGAKLTGRYHKQSYSCEVVENRKGSSATAYRTAGIQESLSGGEGHHRTCLRRWVFWSVQTTENAPAPAVEKPEDAPAAEYRTERGTCDCNCADARKPTPRRLEYFSSPSGKWCRKARFAVLPDCGRASLPRQSRYRDLSGEASGQVKLPDKRIDTRKQAPMMGAYFAW